MIPTRHGIAWEEPTRGRKGQMTPNEPHEPHEATGHFDTYGVSGESCSNNRATLQKETDRRLDGKLDWALFCYIVGGIVLIGFAIGGYWINRTEAANDKCAALSERMSSSERDRESMRADIRDMRDSMKAIEAFIREKK